MAYTKTVWTDGATPLSADNMNHIENGIAALDTGKEDKVTGKGLSTNDYTDDEKAKLAGIQAGAQVNPGAASTSAAGLMSAADKTKLNGIATGAEVNQNAFSNVKVGSTTIAADGKTDTLELVAGSNVTLTPDASNDKVTIAATNTTYESKSAASGGTAVSLVTTGEKYTWNNKASTSAATTSAAGLMSAADKVKLNGIAAGAQVNPGVATTSAAGLMSAADKTRLDSLLITQGVDLDNIVISTGSTKSDISINAKPSFTPAAANYYTPIGVIGYSMVTGTNQSSAHVGAGYCNVQRIRIDGNNVVATIHNRNTSNAAIVHLYAYVLYLRT